MRCTMEHTPWCLKCYMHSLDQSVQIQHLSESCVTQLHGYCLEKGIVYKWAVGNTGGKCSHRDKSSGSFVEVRPFELARKEGAFWQEHPTRWIL